MKRPWNLFCQKAPPRLYPIFHSSNDPDISANALGWWSAHGWQKKKKTANSKLWHIKTQRLFAKGKELTSTTSANLSGQTAHLERFCMVRNMKAHVHCGSILESLKHNRINESVSSCCAAPHLGATTYSPFLWTKQSPVAASPTLDYITLPLCTQNSIH